MARPRESTPDSTSQAVRRLREHLQLTQQQFANTLQVAITTVARWETTRPPRGKALADLELLATSQGQSELASIFIQALRHDLGLIEAQSRLQTSLFALSTLDVLYRALN